MSKHVLSASLVALAVGTLSPAVGAAPAGAVVETINTSLSSPAYSYTPPGGGGQISVPPFGWQVRYDRYFDGISVVKEIDVLFSFTNALGFSNAQKLAWATEAETEIESIWNEQFRIVDTANNLSYDLKVDIRPTVVLAPGADQTVSVEALPAGCAANPNDLACRDSMTRWFTNALPATKAHEVGHMIGLFDEYLGGAVNQAVNPTLSLDGLMGFGAILDNPVMYERYYQQYLDFLSSIAIEQYPGGPTGLSQPNLVLVAVPEPETWLMLLVGAAMVGFGIRRSRT